VEAAQPAARRSPPSMLAIRFIRRPRHIGTVRGSLLRLLETLMSVQ
jgi:hypothetical protein